MPRAILTDIEGTTSSIAFVAETLFPYARARLPGFVAAHPEQVAPILAEVAAAEPGEPVATLIRWIDEDRKATPLKTLQGMIWADGYRERALPGISIQTRSRRCSAGMRRAYRFMSSPRDRWPRRNCCSGIATPAT